MYKVKVIDEAQHDLDKLDGHMRMQVFKGIKKVSKNPLPVNEGGYGKPLGNKNGNNLTGFFKIKYKKIAIRVVYTLVRSDEVMNIVAVCSRDDDDCYNVAEKRKDQYGNKLSEDIFNNL